LVLQQLAHDAAADIGSLAIETTVGVPTSFDMRGRAALLDACRRAGLNVTAIVPEPVATLLHYGAEVVSAERVVVVWDLGGSSFSVTALRVAPDSVTMLGTDGDDALGGYDWDDRLASYLIDSFIDSVHPEEDPSDDYDFVRNVLRIAEETKCSLSRASNRKVAIQFRNAAAVIDVTRQTFADLTRDMLDRTVGLTHRLLERLSRASQSVEINDILLAGGSTVMPMVTDALREEFQVTPLLHDPDLAVAKGAAIAARRGGGADPGAAL
jgi:molecular chaperone DnaK (HSP70)